MAIASPRSIGAVPGALRADQQYRPGPPHKGKGLAAHRRGTGYSSRVKVLEPHTCRRAGSRFVIGQLFVIGCPAWIYSGRGGSSRQCSTYRIAQKAQNRAPLYRSTQNVDPVESPVPGLGLPFDGRKAANPERFGEFALATPSGVAPG